MELDDDGQQRPVTRARPDPTGQTFTLHERRASGYSHKAGEVYQRQCWDAPWGDEELPSRLIAAEIPRLVSARDSLVNKREKLKELDSQIMSLIFVLRKKGSKTKERMKEEEIEKGDCGPPTRKVFFFFLVLSDLNQAVPNHLADESQTR